MRSSTSFTSSDTGGLGSLVVRHPVGAFAPTAATSIALLTLGRRQSLLHGIGIDWGCGIGCLSIAAARIAAVTRVLGLDIDAANVAASQANARANGVAHKTDFVVADSVVPSDRADRQKLRELRGRVDFVVANPPASSGDDGFGFRRKVLGDVASMLTDRGVVLLNVSSQYGQQRIHDLATHAGYSYGGLLESTEDAYFDLARPDLLANLRDYAIEEAGAGFDYVFSGPDGKTLRATEALEYFTTGGQSPLTRWQVHLFTRNAPDTDRDSADRSRRT